MFCCQYKHFFDILCALEGAHGAVGAETVVRGAPHTSAAAGAVGARGEAAAAQLQSAPRSAPSSCR
jgi:hypothetical protein